jgi:hypothetical protein
LYGGYELILGEAADAGLALFNLSVAGLVMALVWILDMVRYRLGKR